MRTIGVPSGIGDVSWMYSKLKHAGRMRWEVADGWPYRTCPFLSLLPEVADTEYGEFRYDDILVFEQAAKINGPGWTWAEVNGRADGRLLIQANRHLEMGKRLEEWLPDLPTDFHYEILRKPGEDAYARELIGPSEGPVIGISAASYRGSEAWKTWGFAEWQPFLKWLKDDKRATIILIGGFWDDLTFALSKDGYKDLVGKTSVSQMIEVLRLLDFYIGFSSGLGVLRTVLKKNAFMMWPDHQRELATSWAPQWMITSGVYKATGWYDPRGVQAQVDRWMDICTEMGV